MLSKRYAPTDEDWRLAGRSGLPMVPAEAIQRALVDLESGSDQSVALAFLRLDDLARVSFIPPAAWSAMSESFGRGAWNSSKASPGSPEFVHEELLMAIRANPRWLEESSKDYKGGFLPAAPHRAGTRAPDPSPLAGACAKDAHEEALFWASAFGPQWSPSGAESPLAIAQRVSPSLAWDLHQMRVGRSERGAQEREGEPAEESAQGAHSSGPPLKAEQAVLSRKKESSELASSHEDESGEGFFIEVEKKSLQPTSANAPDEQKRYDNHMATNSPPDTSAQVSTEGSPSPLSLNDPIMDRLAKDLASGMEDTVAGAIVEAMALCAQDRVTEAGWERLTQALRATSLTPGGPGVVSIFQKQLASRFSDPKQALFAFTFEQPQGDGTIKEVGAEGSLLSRACSQGRVKEAVFWATAMGGNWSLEACSPAIEWATSAPAILKELLARGADANSKNEFSGELPLSLAIAEDAEESCKLLLSSGARWSALAAEDASRLGELLGAQFSSGYAFENFGMLRSAIERGDEPTITDRALEFAVASRASDAQAPFDWVAARRKMRETLGAPEGQLISQGDSAALRLIQKALGESSARSFADKNGARQGNALAAAIALGQPGAVEFWADLMGPEWGSEDKLEEGVNRRPLEWAAESGNGSAIAALLGMGAELAGLTGEDLARVSEAAGPQTLDPLFEQLNERLAQPDEQDLVETLCDLHELATRSLMSDQRWEASLRSLERAIDSQTNFGYQTRARATLAAMPASERTVYLDSQRVEMGEAFGAACAEGQMAKARFWVKALGVSPFPGQKSALSQAMAGGHEAIARMLVAAGANPSEPGLYGEIASGGAKKLGLLIELGAQPHDPSQAQLGSVKEALRGEETERLKRVALDGLAKAPSPEALDALALIERLAPWAVFDERDYQQFSQALSGALTGAQELDRVEFAKRARQPLAELRFPEKGDPLRLALDAGNQQELRFWASVKGVEGLPNAGAPVGDRALAKDAPELVGLLLELGLDPNAKRAERPGQSLAQGAIDKGFGASAIEFLKAGATPFDDNERMVEKARALMRSRPEWSKAIAAIAIEGSSPSADRLVERSTLPLSFAQSLVEGGDLDRFWRLADGFDWSGSVDPFIEACVKTRASGVQAFAQLKSALAHDDLQATRDLIAGNLNLLPALSKRGLAERALIDCIGVGAAPLLDAFANAGWPLAAAIYKNSEPALLACAQSGDKALMSKLAQLCPQTLSASAQAQATIISLANSSGGEEFAMLFEQRLGGFEPEAVQIAVARLRDEGSETGYSCARALVSAALDREEQKGELRGPEESQQRWVKIAGAIEISWPFLTEELRAKALMSAVAAEAGTFWEAQGSGGLGFVQEMLARRPEMLDALLSVASKRNLPNIALAAQMQAARSNDESLAQTATRHGLTPASLEAILAAIQEPAPKALRVYLQSAEPASLVGLLSVVLESPRAAKWSVSNEMAAMLIDGGASFYEPGAAPALQGDKAQRRQTEDARDAVHRAQERLEQFAPGEVEFPPPSRSEDVALAQSLLFGSASWGASDHHSDIFRANVETVLGAVVARDFSPKSAAKVQAVLGQRPDLMEIASDAVLSSPGMVCEALAKDGMALRHASPAVRSDLAACVIACSQNPSASAHIHPALLRALDLSTNLMTPEILLAKLKESQAASKSINPLTMMKRMAVKKAQELAISQARVEISQRRAQQQVDFSAAYRALAGLALSPAQQSMAYSTLSAAVSLAQNAGMPLSPEGKISLTRLWQNNMPLVFEKMGAIPVGERDKPDPETGETPSSVFALALENAKATSRSIRETAIEQARFALNVEGAVVADKASGAINRFAEAVDRAQALSESALSASAMGAKQKPTPSLG